jgi:hypothetical protein
VGFRRGDGSLAAALVVMLTGAPSLAVVPGSFGILVLYAFVRRQPTIAATRAAEPA